ncbi:hypothetical protein F442_08617 [Plasmopara halstedii]|uniref:Uncharacterized protein n=1 Tax=Plasmopara halstedii TaxID=4781 RepID=A0A0P1AND9_PLAHL|nr:hypothetical protein F442_08617 [Plasmopara halstedii]CEG43009.1 hypothetical protein F442_08617 [Plasmopara halstedii]|eukprot:XP_024579378.1 hypothetical protein F442_08617 [Plasmopara halstedii]
MLEQRCTPRVWSIVLLLSLTFMAIHLNFELVWNTPSSSNHAFHRVDQVIVQNHSDPKLQFVQTLHNIAQNTSQSRGIVMPVYDANVKVAASLILELRTMGVNVSIELPHCGDLSIDMQRLLPQKAAFGLIHIYDVCEVAAAATIEGNDAQKLFCENIAACHAKFRSFDVKIISVIYSKFEEVMMIDADTSYFISPTLLWNTARYKATGTFIMNDRIAHEIYYMAERIGGSGNVSAQHRYMARFDPTPFRFLPTLERAKATLPNPVSLQLQFEPSDYLLSSHSWNLRTGHQVDSSLILWNKKKQPRATAILGSFKTLSDIGSPPSYGDKELYFYAAELAESQYSFSDYAIGAVGLEYFDYGENKSTLCGDMAQVFPIKQANWKDVPLFYLNTDRILHFKPESQPVYYMKARLADVYVGPFGERRMECPFEMTGAQFSQAEARHLTARQQLYALVSEWERIFLDSASSLTSKEAKNAAIDGMVEDQMREMRAAYQHVKIPNH